MLCLSCGVLFPFDVPCMFLKLCFDVPLNVLVVVAAPVPLLAGGGCLASFRQWCSLLVFW